MVLQKGTYPIFILTFVILSGIQREEEKTKRMLKENAKKGERDACRILAKEIVRADKTVDKLYASKAHISSVQMSMKQQLGEDRHCNTFPLMSNQEMLLYLCF